MYMYIPLSDNLISPKSEVNLNQFTNLGKFSVWMFTYPMLVIKFEMTDTS